MSAFRVVLFASLVAIGLAMSLFVVPTSATDGEPTQLASGPLQTDDANNTSQAMIGAQISGFMQEQTSKTDGAVESGMWSSAYENSGEGTEKAALVNQRTEGLAAEVASLQAERRELIAARQAGNITDLKFRSRMNGLAGQYTSVMAALDETEPRAEESGADVTTIENLRNVTAEAVGPTVAAAANNARVSPPGLSNNTTVGPPVDVPGQGNGTEIGPGLIGEGPSADVPSGNNSVSVGNSGGTDNDNDGRNGESDNGNDNNRGNEGSGPGNGNLPAHEGPLAKVF